MILSVHLDDLNNITEDQKAELRELFTKHEKSHIIQESHIVISADLVHDSAAVQHFNDKCLTPYLKENVPNLRTHVAVTDGAPQHFKLSDTAVKPRHDMINRAGNVPCDSCRRGSPSSCQGLVSSEIGSSGLQLTARTSAIQNVVRVS